VNLQHKIFKRKHSTVRCQLNVAWNFHVFTVSFDMKRCGFNRPERW